MRFTEISLEVAYSPPIAPSELSNTSSTVACPTGLRPLEPEKITSVSDSPRRRLAALSPITQRIASITLDLPQPLGPTMPVRLVGKCRTVGSTNDLKPASLMVVRRMGQLVGLRMATTCRGECGTVPAGRATRNVAVISTMQGKSLIMIFVWSSDTVRRLGFDRQRVDAAAHQLVQCRVHHTMPFDGALARERCADDAHAEVPAALACVADVQMALVDHFQGLRLQRCGQLRADVFDRSRTHGSVLRNGRTLTSRYTPATT